LKIIYVIILGEKTETIKWNDITHIKKTKWAVELYMFGWKGIGCGPEDIGAIYTVYHALVNYVFKSFQSIISFVIKEKLFLKRKYFLMVSTM